MKAFCHQLLNFRIVRVYITSFFVFLFLVVVAVYVVGCVDYDAELVIENTAQDDGPLSFAVISDTHFGYSIGGGGVTRVSRALQHITSHKDLDALVVVGDLTNNATRAEYDQFEQVFRDKSNFIHPVDQFLFMLGNHDNCGDKPEWTYQWSLRSFNAGKRYPFHIYRVIKGYPFITVSVFSMANQDVYNPYSGLYAYPDETVEWLEQKMALASMECPGKPIFVFTHVPPRWTCIGTWAERKNDEAWCMSVLNPVLNKYPQSVVFAGHTHYPLGDPRSIHQGTDPDSEHQNYYTVINTASTAYCHIPNGVVDAGVTPASYDQVTEGLIVTELDNGDIEIRRYDTYRNEEIAADNRWILKAPFDGSQFTYAGYDGKPAPYFDVNSAVNVEVLADAVAVTFPQAVDNDCVFRYSISVTDAVSGKQVASASIFSQFYLNSDMPKSLTYMIEGLEQGREYNLKIKAYDSYENESNPIFASFIAS